jgi:hypothetical protein
MSKRFENRANVLQAELDPEVFETEEIFERRGGHKDFRLQTSDFRLQTSDFRLQTSDFRVQNSEFNLNSAICNVIRIA